VIEGLRCEGLRRSTAGRGLKAGSASTSCGVATAGNMKTSGPAKTGRQALKRGGPDADMSLNNSLSYTDKRSRGPFAAALSGHAESWARLGPPPPGE